MADRSSATTPYQGRMPALDGFRGVGMLFVLVAHLYFTAEGATRPIDQALGNLHEIGWVFLDTFFVMSGFLITGILLDTKGGPHYFRNFYIRRVLRIFPLYYGALLFLFVLLPSIHIVGRSAIEPLLEAQGWYWSYLTNFLIAKTRLVAIGPSDPNLVNFTVHYWSLAVEEQYYMLWPLVVHLCDRRRLLQICCGLIVMATGLRVVGVLTGAPAGGIYVFTFTRMDSIAAGSLLAILVRTPGWLPWLTRLATPAAASAAAVILGVIALTGEFNQYRPLIQLAGYSIVVLGSAGLVILLVTEAPEAPLGRFFRHPWFMFLGKHSYAIYVFHTIVLLFVWESFTWTRQLPLIYGYGWPASVAFMALCMAFAILVGFLSWHLWEHPFLRLKDRFEYGGARAGRAQHAPPAQGANGGSA